MAASCISVPAASPQNSQANSTKGRSRRLRARTLAANSITSEEEDESFWVQYSVTDVQGCQERGDVELPLKHFNFHTERWRTGTHQNDVNTGHRCRETQGS